MKHFRGPCFFDLLGIFYKDLQITKILFTKIKQGIKIHFNSQENLIGGDLVFIILYAGTVAVLITAAIKDVRSSRIPNILLIVLILIQAISEIISHIWCNDLVIEGANLIYCFFTLLFLFPFFRMGGLGAGDCKLISLTIMSVRHPVFFLLSVFTIAALDGVFQILIKKKEKDTKITLGVPILLAYILAVIYDLQMVT